MSAARREILERVRGALSDLGERSGGPTVARDYSVASGLDRAARLGLFGERVTAYRAGFRCVAPAGVPETVAEVLSGHGVRVLAVPPVLRPEWIPSDVQIVPDLSLSVGELDRVDGALTGCALAIAETGTIVLDAGPGQGRRALTLVPDLHVCLVEAEQIVGSVPEAIRALEKGASTHGRPLTFVSGPSATSDIGFHRVEGVHGPRRLEVVVVD